MTGSPRTYEILVVDDNPGEARLVREAWQHCQVVNANVSMLEETIQVLKYLRHAEPYGVTPTPDLIMLDYKMPIDGGLALTEIKGDPETVTIPVIVLTGSRNPDDHIQIYRRHANACFLKPDDLESYLTLICDIAKHWLTHVHLPPKPRLTPGG